MSGKGSQGTMRIFCQHLLLSNVSVQRLLHLDFCELRKELVLNLILTVVKWHDCRFTISAETKAWLGVPASAFSWVAESSTAAGKKKSKSHKKPSSVWTAKPFRKAEKIFGLLAGTEISTAMAESAKPRQCDYTLNALSNTEFTFYWSWNTCKRVTAAHSVGTGRGEVKKCKEICANLLSENVCSQHSTGTIEPYPFNGIKHWGSNKRTFIFC